MLYMLTVEHLKLGQGVGMLHESILGSKTLTFCDLTDSE